MVVATRGNKPKVLTGLLTKEEICEIVQITPEDFDYHMNILVKSGLVNCYVKK